MSDFHLKTEVFEGPIELLLDLVEKKKLAIKNISLAQVADEYIAHIKQLEEFSIPRTTQFILIASTLVLLKSLALLPGLVPTEEEAGDIKNLEARLLLYQELRRVAGIISEEYKKAPVYFRSERGTIPVLFAPGTKITPEGMHAAIMEVYRLLPKPELRPEVSVEKVVSLEEMLGRLVDRITHAEALSFDSLTGSRSGKTIGKEARAEIIITFLAVLELVKQEILAADQGEYFGDITLSKNKPEEVIII